MKVFESSWEAARAGLTRVRIDDSVLDQMLLGCAAVYWEIQALHDQGLVVETTPPDPHTGADLAALRDALRRHCELSVQRHLVSVDAAFGSAPRAVDVAMWSAGGSPGGPGPAATPVVYQPQILLAEDDRPLIAQALRRAQRIGAISSAVDIRFENPGGLLHGLHPGGRATAARM